MYYIALFRQFLLYIFCVCIGWPSKALKPSVTEFSTASKPAISQRYDLASSCHITLSVQGTPFSIVCWSTRRPECCSETNTLYCLCSLLLLTDHTTLCMKNAALVNWVVNIFASFYSIESFLTASWAGLASAGLGQGVWWDDSLSQS